MNSLMHWQMATDRKSLVTHITWEWLFTCMYSIMNHQLTSRFIWLSTNIISAISWLQTANAFSQISQEYGFSPVWILLCVTAIKLLRTENALCYDTHHMNMESLLYESFLSFQVTTHRKCLFTYIAFERLLPSVNFQVGFIILFVREF